MAKPSTVLLERSFFTFCHLCLQCKSSHMKIRADGSLIGIYVSLLEPDSEQLLCNEKALHASWKPGWHMMNSLLNTVCFMQFAAVYSVSVPISDNFLTLICKYQCYLLTFMPLPSLYLNPLVQSNLYNVPLKAIETNKGAESHTAGLYTQGPRMIFLIVFICNP